MNQLIMKVIKSPNFKTGVLGDVIIAEKYSNKLLSELQ
jgi:hypothetical protein